MVLFLARRLFHVRRISRELKKSNFSNMGKRWSSTEAALACRAYASATNDSVNGADQRAEVFNQKLVEVLELLSPSEVEEGTHYHRGDRVFPYLRDNVFPDVMKFNKSLRVVEMSGPSGVTDDQKVNMAVAIHLNKTKKMECMYKDFDAKEWRFYTSWKELRNLPKFRFFSNEDTHRSEDSEASGVPESVSVTTGASDSSTSSVINSIVGERASGSGKGRDAAKESKKKNEEATRKRKRDEKRDEMFGSLVVNLEDVKNTMLKKCKVNALCRAVEIASDPEVKARLEAKLLELVDDSDF